MSTTLQPTAELHGEALEAWRSYLKSHACLMRQLDAELVHEHGLTARDYEVLLQLAHAPERKLGMSELAERTLLTRSGITRLVDGLQKSGWIERCPCPSDARVSYARLTDAGEEKLKAAGRTHLDGIRRLFLGHFTDAEVAQLADLLGRLPVCSGGGDCSKS